MYIQASMEMRPDSGVSGDLFRGDLFRGDLFRGDLFRGDLFRGGKCITLQRSQKGLSKEGGSPNSAPLGKHCY